MCVRSLKYSNSSQKVANNVVLVGKLLGGTVFIDKVVFVFGAVRIALNIMATMPVKGRHIIYREYMRCFGSFCCWGGLDAVVGWRTQCGHQQVCEKEPLGLCL